MGLFDKFRQGLEKTRRFIAGGIEQISGGLGIFDEDMLDELEVVLIRSDIGVAATTEIMRVLRARLKDRGESSRQAVMRLLNEILVEILGPARSYQPTRGALNVLLLVGVNGSGKTTTAGKLCWRLHREGYRVLLAAADTFRAAAIEQLEIWARRAETPLITQKTGSDPAAVVFDAVQAAKARRSDVLIIDTAGRLQNKQNLMDELAKIRRVVSREAPDAQVVTLLTIDATNGQNAISQAKVFGEVADVSGVAITKLDGNSKGGVAVAVSYETRLPILLAGLGEGIDDLVDFDPQNFVGALLPDS